MRHRLKLYQPDLYFIEEINLQNNKLGCWTGIEAYLYSVRDCYYRTDVYYSTMGSFKRDIELFPGDEYIRAVEYYQNKIKEFKLIFIGGN
jgi:hypothetical protein